MLAGKRPPGERVVVYDCEGYFVAAGLAELLASEGHAVELVTPFDVVSPESDHTLEGALLRRRLHDAGVQMTRNVTIGTVTADRIEGHGEFAEPWARQSEAIVLVTQRLSDDALYNELCADENALHAEGIEAVYRVGDCVAPGLIADAVFSGHRLAREIDTANPAVPLPVRRELPTPAAVGASSR